MRITLTLESAFPCLISALEHLEYLQEQHLLKIISIAVSDTKALSAQVCTVVLNEVSDGIDFLHALIRQLRVLNTLHSTPIQVLSFQTSTSASERSSAHES